MYYIPETLTNMPTISITIHLNNEVTTSYNIWINCSTFLKAEPSTYDIHVYSPTLKILYSNLQLMSVLTLMLNYRFGNLHINYVTQAVLQVTKLALLEYVRTPTACREQTRLQNISTIPWLWIGTIYKRIQQ